MISRSQRQHITGLFLFLLLLPLSVVAAEITDSPLAQQPEQVVPHTTLPPVTIEASRIAPLTLGTSLDREQIEQIPARNANTSDLLNLMPGVQLPEGDNSSNTAGEIAPASVSISGGRPYDNNFLIDGVGNNSLLDPESTNPSSIDNVPGHSQEIFLLNNLVDSITVMRSNIPARYGNFTGGVIDVTTIDPAPEFSGSLIYRTTRSEWTSFHIDLAGAEDFKNSTTEKEQPRFTKQHASITLHTPLNDRSGLVFDYAILASDIPLHHLGDDSVPQHRKNENYFLKYKSHFDGNSTLSLSGLYAPYEGDFFLKDTRDSGFKVRGGGYTVNAKFEHSGESGDSEVAIAIKTSENSRRGPDNWYNWRNTGSKDWGPKNYSKEGGYGDIDKSQQSLAANLHHQFNDFRAAAGIHRFSSGLNAEYAEANFDRLSQTTQYAVASANPGVDCNGDNSDCIDGEQFMWYKNVYSEDSADTHLAQLSVYLEDNVIIKRLTLRPGLRSNWDDYLENLNLAPRFAAAYDIFGDGSSILIAGANRYYGRNLLTIRLAEEKAPYTTWQRSTTLDNNQPLPWTEKDRSSIPTSRVADLDTPYSNELTAGLRQKLFKGMLELDYTVREGHDLIVTRAYDTDPDTHIKYSEWSNAGRSHHQEVDISWKRQWGKNTLILTATWQKTTGNSNSYLNSETGLDELIWYKGKVGTKDELLIDDYNRPYKISLIYTTTIDSRLHFTNTTIYRSSYTVTEKSGDTHLLPDGTPVDVYEDVTNDHALLFDWRFALDVVQKKNLNFALTLDLYNVFDYRSKVGNSDTEYELGRQLWLGATCTF